MRLIDADELRIKPEYMHDICGEVMIRVEDIARIINEMTPVDPQPKWIPVSEMLPEIGEYVLCSQDNGDVGEGKLLDSGSWLICYDQICHGSYWVNAWMPLPDRWNGDVTDSQDESTPVYLSELYLCDPDKNTECKKTACYRNGGECIHTVHKEYRRVE